ALNALHDNHRRFILTLMVEALDTNAALSSEFREMLQRFRGFHRRLIRQGQERGIFRKDVDVAVAAIQFVSGILGAEIQCYQDPAGMDRTKTLECQVEQFLAWLTAPTKRSQAASGGRKHVDLEMTEDQKLIHDTVTSFAKAEIRPLARECDESGTIPAEI